MSSIALITPFSDAMRVMSDIVVINKYLSYFSPVRWVFVEYILIWLESDHKSGIRSVGSVHSWIVKKRLMENVRPRVRSQ